MLKKQTINDNNYRKVKDYKVTKKTRTDYTKKLYKYNDSVQTIQKTIIIIMMMITIPKVNIEINNKK